MFSFARNAFFHVSTEKQAQSTNASQSSRLPPGLMPKMTDIGSRSLFTPEQDAFRETVRKFMQKEMIPNVARYTLFIFHNLDEILCLFLADGKHKGSQTNQSGQRLVNSACWESTLLLSMVVLEDHLLMLPLSLMSCKCALLLNCYHVFSSHSFFFPLLGVMQVLEVQLSTCTQMLSCHT